MRQSLNSIFASTASFCLLAVALAAGGCDLGEEASVTPEEAQLCQMIAEANGVFEQIPASECRVAIDQIIAAQNGENVGGGESNGSSEDNPSLSSEDIVSTHLGSFTTYP